jgi:hypothetical protein
LLAKDSVNFFDLVIASFGLTSSWTSLIISWSEKWFTYSRGSSYSCCWDKRILMPRCGLTSLKLAWKSLSDSMKTQIGADYDVVVPMKSISLIRTLNTFTAFWIELHTLQALLPLDRLSTHPEENCFGLLRRICRNHNYFAQVVHHSARQCLVGECLKELGHPSNVCKRGNLGECVAIPG